MTQLRNLPRLMLSTAALIFAAAVLIFALKYDVSPAYAVSSHMGPMPSRGTIFTQSADGKTLYQWTYSTKDKGWKKEGHKKSW